MDVYYPDAGGSCGALVIADDPRFENLIAEHVRRLETVAEYQSGYFFARELPTLRALLASAVQLDLIVIDGYVDLDPNGRPGLGAHLYREIRSPVIGVAKNPFRTATHAVKLLRGRATKPLYITSAGIPANDAAVLVEQMSGRHRIPDALRRADALARGG